MYKNVAVWENGQWSKQAFATRDEFKQFVYSVFSEPGKYGFDETSSIFIHEAERFRKQGFYCEIPMRSKDYVSYWDDQKDKCRNGVIVRNNGKTWYLTREYYMCLNFLPINDKEKRKFDFPSVYKLVTKTFQYLLSI